MNIFRKAVKLLFQNGKKRKITHYVLLLMVK